MADEFGVSFDPTQQQAGGETQKAGRAPQQAIEMRSLHLPKFIGSGGIAAAPLLTSPGSAGQPESALMQLLRQLLLKGQAPGAPEPSSAPNPLTQLMQQIAGMGGQPTQTQPHITPGIEPGDHPSLPPVQRAPEFGQQPSFIPATQAGGWTGQSPANAAGAAAAGFGSDVPINSRLGTPNGNPSPLADLFRQKNAPMGDLLL